MNPEELKNPTARFRPAPFWSWNGDLDPVELQKQIKDMAAKGWGGYFMHSRVGLITPYLGKAWHDAIRACVKTAAETGTDAWLYDEDKWPSGFAGGLVPEAGPEYRMRVLKCVPEAEVDPVNDTVLATHEHEGQKWAIARHIMPLGDAWYNGASYVDTMNPAVVKKFLDITIDGYRDEVGKHFGKEIPGIFTDEPCYLHYGKYLGSLPWTEGLPAFFLKRKGYALESKLVALFFTQPESRRVRFDFFDCVTRLFLESFGKQYYERCEKNRLIFTGHYMAEDSLESQTQWIGAAMPHYEFQHWPGIDKLARHVEQTVTCKQVSSAAEQLGKERTFCEVFGVNGQHFDFRGRRWIHNWEAALGINFVNHHLSLYTMMGERKRDYPPNFFYQQPYWEYEKGLSDYFGRLNYFLTRGKRQVDTLILHPIGSFWGEYEVLKYRAKPAWGGQSPEGTGKLVDQAFRSITDRFLARRLDFHYGDEIIMEKHARVDGAKFRVARGEYDVVVVPPSLTWRKETVARLLEFSKAGGKLIFVGLVPTLQDAHEALDYRALFPKAEFVATIDDAVAAVRRAKKNLITAEHDILKREVDEIFIHVREDGGKILVFLTNTHETKRIPARITLPWSGEILQVTDETGDLAPFIVETVDGTSRFLHDFHGGAGLMLLIDPKKAPVPKTAKPAATKALKLGSWQGRPLDANVVRCDRVSLWMGGKQVLERAPIHQAWDNHFYKAADGTPFAAEYRFLVGEKPDGALSAVIEMARNLDRITLNGKALKPSGARWLQDSAFDLLDAGAHVVPGENVLRIEGKKLNNITRGGCHRRVKDSELPFRNTEVEVVYLVGDFLVENHENREFTVTRRRDEFIPLADVTTAGYPFYAGRFAFTGKLNLGQKTSQAWIEISDVQAPCVEVLVNGKSAGAALWSPFRLDISKHVAPGENQVELRFPTDLYNVMGPNPLPGGLPKAVSPGSFREEGNWSEELFLLRRGIGGVRVSVET